MSESHAPRISVLMATYNESNHLAAAVESILGQSFADFEFLIADDVSTDDTWNRLQAFARRDQRIRLSRNERHLGLPESLNRLVDKARGAYIARMDADDIAVQDRFRRQLSVLDTDEADVCAGSFIEFPCKRPVVRGRAVDADEFRISVLFEWSIMHPTVMLKSDLLRRHRYRAELVPAADYDLWARLAPIARVVNLPDVLLLKRVHDQQISARYADRRMQATKRVQRLALEAAGICPTDRELELHAHIWLAEPPRSWGDLVETEQWISRLHDALGDGPGVRRHLARRWYYQCLKSTRFGTRTYGLFQRSPLSRLQPSSVSQRFALWALCLMRVPYESALYWRLVSLHPAAHRSSLALTHIPRELRSYLRYDGPR